MHNRSYYDLGRLHGTRITVVHTALRQDILIEHNDLGHRLINLLAPWKAMREEDRYGRFWRVPHDREVDALIVDLIDLLITLRDTHPFLGQLDLRLDEEHV